MKEYQIEKTDEVSKKFSELGEKIEKELLQVELINKREEMMNWKKTDFELIRVIQKEFIPYNRVNPSLY